MAWFSGKVSLGNFPDFSDAVNKLSESVKNIEKNFDNALGLEEKSDASGSGSETSGGLWPSTDRKALFDPIIGFMGQKGGEGAVESLEKSTPSKQESPVKEKQAENDNLASQESEQVLHVEQVKEDSKNAEVEPESEEETKSTVGESKENAGVKNVETEVDLPSGPIESPEHKNVEIEQTESIKTVVENEKSEEIYPTASDSIQPESAHNFQEERSDEVPPTHFKPLQPESTSPVGQNEVIPSVPSKDAETSLPDNLDTTEKEGSKDVVPAQALDASHAVLGESKELSESESLEKTREAEDSSTNSLPVLLYNDAEASKEALDMVTPLNDAVSKTIELTRHPDKDPSAKERSLGTGSNVPDSADTMAELQKLKKEMKMMETALQGAARQAQAKADEIAKLMSENEQLKSVIDDLKDDV